MKRGADMPYLKVKVLGKTFVNRYGYNSPTHMRGSRQPILVHVS